MLEQTFTCTTRSTRQCSLCGKTQYSTEVAVGLEVSPDAVLHGLKRLQVEDPDVRVPSLRSALRSFCEMDHPIDGYCDNIACPGYEADSTRRPQAGTSSLEDGDSTGSIMCVGRVLPILPRTLTLWISQVHYGPVALDRPVSVPLELKIHGVRFHCDWIAVRRSSHASEESRFYSLIRHSSGQWVRVDSDKVTWMGVFNSHDMRSVVTPSGRERIRTDVPAAVGYSVVQQDKKHLESWNQASAFGGIGAAMSKAKGIVGYGDPQPAVCRAPPPVASYQEAPVSLAQTPSLTGTRAASCGTYPNGGNTCCFAAVLQSLQHQPTFMELLEEAANQDLEAPMGEDPRPLCHKLLELMVRCKSGGSVPLRDHRWLADLNGSFTWGLQVDASEFYVSVVDQCGLDRLTRTAVHYDYKSLVTCNSCHIMAIKSERGSLLTVGLPQEPLRVGALTLDSLLQHHFAHEALLGDNQYNCIVCRAKVRLLPY